MSNSAALGQKKSAFHSKESFKARRPKTLAEYLPWNPRDGFKYEWVNSNILKLPKMITPEQAHIADNLMRFFVKTKAYSAGDSFMPELKSLTIGEQVRVPDIAYVTAKQLWEMSQKKAPTPLFVVEIISDSDGVMHIETKLEEYFQAGVQVLWHILPEFEKIYIYTSPENITVCRGNTLCSAESVVKGFVLPAKDVFKKRLPPPQ